MNLTPLSLLYHIDSVSLNFGTEAQPALVDMCCIAVYFMCLPGEYTSATKGSTPFHFKDSELCIGGQRLYLQTTKEQKLEMEILYTLNFTDQKNAVCDEFV